MQEAVDMVASTLGRKVVNPFKELLDNYVYFVKSLSMTTLNEDLEIIESQLKNVAGKIIRETIVVFLKKSKHAVSTMSKDKARKIPEIVNFKKCSDNIVKVIVEEGMSDLRKGRIISKKIVERSNKFRSKAIASSPIPTSLEAIEAEIIKIESKLPNLSEDETRTLLNYYKMDQKAKRLKCIGNP